MIVVEASEQDLPSSYNLLADLFAQEAEFQLISEWWVFGGMRRQKEYLGIMDIITLVGIMSGAWSSRAGLCSG